MNNKEKNRLNLFVMFLFAIPTMLMISFNLSGQQVEMDKSFIDIFDRETGINNQKDSSLNIPKAVKSFLPDEFTNFISGNSVFSIGISDTETDPVRGYQQAYYRAFLLAALQQKSQIKMVSESFASQKEKADATKSKYEEMYRINAVISFNDSFPVIASYRLPSNETILLLAHPRPRKQALNSGLNKLFQNDKHNELKVSCALYHLENIADRSQQIFRTDYEITKSDSDKVDPHNEKFCFTFVNNRWCKLSTWFNGSETERPNMRYYYYLKDPVQPTDSIIDKSVGSTTSEGLWPALVTSVLWQVSGKASGNNITFKQVSDYYKQTVIHLNSTVENKMLRFNLKKLLLDSGCLYSVLDIETLNSEK